jgi:hypothetical protein
MEVDDDKITVNDLPDEVMVEIFTFLNPKVVKIAALVNQR